PAGGDAEQAMAPPEARHRGRRPSQVHRIRTVRDIAASWVGHVPLRPYPYVSLGPRPDTCNGPCRQLGADGPWIRRDVTTPWPTARAIFDRIWDCIKRNWVAHAVDSAVTYSTLSCRDCGAACSAISAPTTS